MDTEKTVSPTDTASGGESFTKGIATTLADNVTQLSAPPQLVKTFRQELTIWIIRLIAVSMVPLSATAVSYGVKRAELHSEADRKRREEQLRKRQLQLQLLTQIIAVAKQADFKNPTSLYRLGLIAHMVNENHRVFGIELREAEETMKRMFEQLAPISGLRKSLADSDVVIKSLNENYQTAQKNEDSLLDAIDLLKKKLSDTNVRYTQRRAALRKQIKEDQQKLAAQQDRRLFFETRLYREKQLRQFFQEQLNRQASQLKVALQDASTLRTRLKDQTWELTKLAERLEKASSSAALAKKLLSSIKNIEMEHQKASQMIKRLQAELKSEKSQLQEARQDLTECRANEPKDTFIPPVKPPIMYKKKAAASPVRKPSMKTPVRGNKRPTATPRNPMKVDARIRELRRKRVEASLKRRHLRTAAAIKKLRKKNSSNYRRNNRRNVRRLQRVLSYDN